jgi:hypothetical protein
LLALKNLQRDKDRAAGPIGSAKTQRISGLEVSRFAVRSTSSYPFNPIGEWPDRRLPPSTSIARLGTRTMGFYLLRLLIIQSGEAGPGFTVRAQQLVQLGLNSLGVAVFGSLDKKES